eukprot:EG_transcript_1398
MKEPEEDASVVIGVGDLPDGPLGPRSPTHANLTPSPSDDPDKAGPPPPPPGLERPKFVHPSALPSMSEDPGPLLKAKARSQGLLGLPPRPGEGPTGNLAEMHAVEMPSEEVTKPTPGAAGESSGSAQSSRDGSNVSEQVLLPPNNIAWVRNRWTPLKPQPQLGPNVTIASKQENFRLYSFFWRLMDLLMACFFLLLLMCMMTFLLTQQITLFFIVRQPASAVTFFMQLTTLAFPIICASLSITIWRLILNTASGYEFMDLRLFLHLHFIRRRHSHAAMLETEGGLQPAHRQSRRAKWFIQVFIFLITVSLLVIPFVAGAAVAIAEGSVSVGLQWLLTFGIMAAAATAILAYLFNLASLFLQLRDGARALRKLRPAGYRKWTAVVEYLNCGRKALLEAGLREDQCYLLSLDVFIDHSYGIFRKVKMAHADAVSSWVTYRTPQFGSVWFLQVLCMLVSTVLSGIALAEVKPEGSKTALYTFSLSTILLPAAAFKLAATVLAVLARPSTIHFLKQHRQLSYMRRPSGEAPRLPPEQISNAGLLLVRLLAFLSFGVSLILLWVLCGQSDYPVWLAAVFMPAVLLGDLWALLPLIWLRVTDVQCCSSWLQGTKKSAQHRLKLHRVALMWLRAGLIVAILLTYLILGLVAAVVANFKAYIVMGLLVCFLTLSVAFVLFRRVYLTGTYCCLLIFYYVFALAILISIETAALAVPEVSEFIPNVSPIPGAANGQYPVCESRWAARKKLPTGDAYSLDIVDFALMNQLTSLPNVTVVQQQLPVWFPEGWILAYRSPSMAPRFDHFYNPDLETSVVVVRGTKTIGDIVQDLYLWAPAGILQIFSLIVPLLQLLPISVIRWLIAAASFEDWMEAYGHETAWGYQYPVLEYVQANCSGHLTYITGHSMGGSIAAVVGINLNLSVVSLSGPGISYSVRKFKVPEAQDWLQRRPILTIMPDNDVVPRIDLQLGLVQHIACHGDVGYCHDLPSTICELIRTCGDPMGRVVHPKVSAPCQSFDY